MRDALILAIKADFDVYNALDIFQNGDVLKELKFGIGDGRLQVLSLSLSPSLPPSLPLSLSLSLCHSDGPPCVSCDHHQLFVLFVPLV